MNETERLTLQPRRWVIRDENHGLGIYTSDLGWLAVADFLRDRERGDVAARLTDVEVLPDGSTRVTYNGRTFRAVPCEDDHESV